MIESLAVTLLPVLFLIILFGGGGLLRRRNIDMDGEPPIDKMLFYSSKYAIMAMWSLFTIESSWRRRSICERRLAWSTRIIVAAFGDICSQGCCTVVAWNRHGRIRGFDAIV